MIPRRWIPTALWAGLVLVGTSIPGSTVPDGPAGADKLVHFGSYAVLGTLATRARLQTLRGPLLPAMSLLLLAVAAFATFDEAHQRFVPGRSADVRDLIADVAGAAVAIALTAAALARREQST